MQRGPGQLSKDNWRRKAPAGEQSGAVTKRKTGGQDFRDPLTNGFSVRCVETGGRAELLEPGLYRLSQLLRGRRGTEWACALHSIGERFCLFNPAELAAIELPAGATGAMLRAVSHGIADSAPLPEVVRMIEGEAVRPLPVCYLRAWREGSSIHVSWVRRSQRG